MKKLLLRGLTVWLACTSAAVSAQTNTAAVLFPDEDALTPEQWKVVWPATPGLRYEVQQSTNLQTWTTAPGYPATATGPAQQMAFSTTNSAGFFKVRELDEQPPTIASQYPTDGGFAVPRFSNLSFQLADATGIATNSIRLTVGSLGTFVLNSTNLHYTNGLLTFLNGGSIPLGGWGSNVTATLVMADTLGFAATNTTTFSLEVEPQVVSNLFVFGSPQAQRAGQQVGNIPTRALAQRLGPIPMGAGDPWTLELVASNRLELSYTNTTPVFSVGQYVCNLTPVTTDDIFYRKIISLSDNTGLKRLTLYTTNVLLAEILGEGSASISPNSVLYQVTNNVIVRAYAFNDVIPFGAVGLNTSQTLYDAGGVTLRLNEAKFLFTPSLALSFETRYATLKRFSATLTGRLETAVVPQLTVTGNLSGTKTFDLYSHKTLVFVGWAGAMPVWLDFDFNVGAEIGYDLTASATLTTGIRQDASLSFGVDYVKDRSPQLQGNPSITFDPMEIVPFTHQINGSGSAYAKLIPQLDIRVTSLAGLYANVDPRVEIEGSATLTNGHLSTADFSIAAKADLNVGFSVIGYGSIEPPLATYRLFNYPWSAHYPPPPQIVIRHQPESQTVKVGDTVSFTVDATCSQPLSYQWFYGVIPIPGKTGPTLVLINVTNSDAGPYYVRVSSGSLATNSADAWLAVVPRASLVAMYAFWGDARDASGFGNHGTPHGVSLIADSMGLPNSAYWFNGSGYITVPSSASLKVQGTNLTLSAWVKPSQFTGSGNGRTLLRKQSQTGNSGGYFLRLSNTGYLNFGGRSGYNPGFEVTARYGVLPTNTWSQVAAAYDGAAVRFYVNGSLVDSLPLTNRISADDDGLTLGVLSASTLDEFFYGGLDDVRIYNRTLSAAEILSFYNSSLPVPAPSSGMALIPAGSFTMGDNLDGSSYALPLHYVYVSAFYMDRTEVTKALWDEVYGWAITHGYSFSYAGSGKAAKHPVQRVTWYDVVKWCNARSEKEGKTPAYYTSSAQTAVYRTGQIGVQNDWVKWNGGYRLATEAEWEKAARGGARGQRFPWGNTISHSLANYSSSSSYAYDISPTRGYHPTFNDGVSPYTSPAGYFGANGYGLYDMAGNVWEWCWDWYGSYGSASQTDPRGPTSGSYRVDRGGSCYYNAFYCRTAFRNYYVNPTYGNSDLGFRSVLSPGQ